MPPNIAKRILNRILRPFRKDWDAFLKDSSGVIHIGANEGQEREQYAVLGLPVIWVEPIPEVFEILSRNISTFPKQKAFQYLLADKDEAQLDFHIASNGGASSSILDLARHTEIFPDIVYTKTMQLFSITLASFLDRECVDSSVYNALVMDTQGSELLILRGGRTVLQRFRYVKVEAADFEAYKGCCNANEIVQFMASCGFQEKCRHRFDENPLGGAYYNIVFHNRHPVIADSTAR